MLSLVASFGSPNPSPNGEDDDPRYAPIEAFLRPFRTDTDLAPLNPDLGHLLTPTEFRFLVGELVCTLRWRKFDAVCAGAHLLRLARMNPQECLAFLNDRQAAIEAPWLTDPLKGFGQRHKRYYGCIPRPFLAALFAAILTS